MVGVARIELATPTMSTQRLWGKVADFRHFVLGKGENGPGTDRISARVSRKFCARIFVQLFATVAAIQGVMTDSLHDRLQSLFDQVKDFPEAGRCEHGTHLKPQAFAAFLDLRQLIEREVLPALHRMEAQDRQGPQSR